MDIDLSYNATGRVAWRDLSLTLAMENLPVASRPTKPSQQQWALNFSLFPKVKACSLPPVHLVEYVQSFAVYALTSDDTTELTAYFQA